MSGDDEQDVDELLHELRAAAGTSLPPGTYQLLRRLENAVRTLQAERNAMRARLERPLTPPPHASPERLEELVRKLGSLDSTSQ
jgi:hypothetical protein